MAETHDMHDMKEARATFAGLMALFKWGAVGVALITALVIYLLTR